MNSEQRVVEVFANHCDRQRYLELWSLPQVLKELKLKISQQELFNFLTELQLPQRISLG